jgi:hypothetical protein
LETDASLIRFRRRKQQTDPGCDEVDFFNEKETAPGTNTAVSSFVKLTFGGSEVFIEYVDETLSLWGQELWDAKKGA